MDESGCFHKTLPDKGLVEKGKQAKGDKRAKQRFTIPLFVTKQRFTVAHLLMMPRKKSKNQLLYEKLEWHVVLED